MTGRLGKFAALLALFASLGWPQGLRAETNRLAQVTLPVGTIEGERRAEVLVYRGLPYAAPPLGQLRWAPPQPPPAWSGVRPGLAFGPACPQPITAGGPNLGGYVGPTSEDCLTANVWTPRKARRAPVMVWIHGGGHRFGAGSVPAYDGSAFAKNGVVLVTFNYRLAGLGYFAHPALTAQAANNQPLASYGLMDQLHLLRWVRDNIAAFGGDPHNVTLFGVSSGGMDVLALMNTPESAGLFRRAIVQSGGGWDTPPTLAEMEQAGLELARRQGLGTTAAELRAAPADVFHDPEFRMNFQPVTDGRLLMRTTAQGFAEDRAADIPLIVGATSFEGSVMSPGYRGLDSLFADAGGLYPAGQEGLRALYGDRYQAGPARWIAARAADGAPSFLYRFSYARSGAARAPHGSDIAFVFDSWERVGVQNLSARDRRTTRLMHACWVSFAKTGRLRCVQGGWPRYSPTQPELLDIDGSPARRASARSPRLDALERLVLPDLLRAQAGRPAPTAGSRSPGSAGAGRRRS